MAWTVHRTCRTCGRKFSWQANGTISRHQCDECRDETYGQGDHVTPLRVEGVDIEALERASQAEYARKPPVKCRGWAESDLEHLAHG